MIHSAGLLTQSSACRTISERSLPLRILGMSNVVATESFSITMERKCLCPLIVTHGPDQVLCLRRDLPHVALDKFMAEAFRSMSQWKVDVTNHAKSTVDPAQGVTAKSYLSDFGTNWLPKSVLSSRYMPFKSLAEKTQVPISSRFSLREERIWEKRQNPGRQDIRLIAPICFHRFVMTGHQPPPCIS